MLALLLLANALTWAYGQGFLGFLGLGIPTQREPQRMTQQILPQQLRLLNSPAPENTTDTAQESAASDASPTPATDLTPETTAPVTVNNAPAATACWTAPGFNAAQTITLNATMQAQKNLNKRWSLEVAVNTPTRTYNLRLPAITEAERQQIEALPALAGKRLQPCT